MYIVRTSLSNNAAFVSTGDLDNVSFANDIERAYSFPNMSTAKNMRDELLAKHPHTVVMCKPTMDKKVVQAALGYNVGDKHPTSRSNRSISGNPVAGHKTKGGNY